MPDGSYAQTNLQLLNQLRAVPWPLSEVVLVHNAYEWALPLFSAQFRPSGKPFLAHLVGTASVLADHGARAEVVAAGLLHASYAQGEWGDGHGGAPVRARREALQAALGTEVEDLVHRYTGLRWNATSVADLRRRATELTPPESDVVLMRLANLLEDYLDLGMAYCDKGQKTTHDDSVLDAAVAMAREMGVPALAEELARAVDDNHSTDLAPDLRRRAHSSDTVAPRSHQRRPALVALDTARAAKKRLRGVVGG